MFKEFIIYMNGINLQFSHWIKGAYFNDFTRYFNQSTGRNNVEAEQRVHFFFLIM